jgi:hypothetical protein
MRWNPIFRTRQLIVVGFVACLFFLFKLHFDAYHLHDGQIEVYDYVNKSMDPSDRSYISQRTEAGAHLLTHNSTGVTAAASKMASPKIFFVHVGKTGGTTLQNNVVLFNCQRFGNHAKRKEYCLNFLNQYGESELSKQTIGLMHYSTRIPRRQKDIDQMDFLFAIREPIARLASSYEYQNPHNCVKGKQEMGMTQKCGVLSKAKNNPESFYARFYLDCFQTFESFMNYNPNHDTSSHKDVCQDLWSTAFRPGLFDGYFHITANYQYYTKDLDLRPNVQRKVWVIRTEKLWHDVSRVDKRVGGSGNFAHVRGRVFNKQTRTRKIGTAPLHLCCALLPDIVAFSKIVNRAENLDAQEKLEYNQKSWTRCNATSLEMLQTQCDRHYPNTINFRAQ